MMNSATIVVFYVLVLFNQSALAVLGFITRDTLFMKAYGKDKVPYAILVVAAVSGPVNRQVAAYSAKFGQVFAMAGSGVVVAAVYCFLWVGSSISTGVIAQLVPALVYVVVELTNLLLGQLFWDLCSSSFDVKQSKQFFGAIGIGSTFGTFFTGFFLVGWLEVNNIHTSENLLVMAGMCIVLGLTVLIGVPLFVPKISSVTATQKTTRSTKAARATNKNFSANEGRSGFQEARRRPYIRHLCLFELCATVARVLIDFDQFAVLSDYDEVRVKKTLGIINGLQSCLMIPLQALAGPLFTRYGVMNGIAALPFSIAIFGSATAFSSSVFLLIGVRAFYNAISYAIFNTARELLWLPLASDDRSLIKPYITGEVRSVSRIFGAGMSLILAQTVSDTTPVSIVIGILGILWMVDAHSATQSYAMEFYAALKQGHIEFSSAHVDITPDQVALVKETLRKGNANQKRFLLDRLPASQLPLFKEELRNIFYANKSPVSTPLPLRLRIMDMHMSFVQSQSQTGEWSLLQGHSQRDDLDEDSSFVGRQDSSIQAEGIFSAEDLLSLAHGQVWASPTSGSDVSRMGSHSNLQGLQPATPFTSTIPYRLRVGAVIALGHVNGWKHYFRCRDALEKLLEEPFEDMVSPAMGTSLAAERTNTMGNLSSINPAPKSSSAQSKRISIAAAIGLLKITKFVHQRAHIIVQRFLHNDSDTEGQVICLKLVSAFLPELISNGYLVYLLHHPSPKIVATAIDICRSTASTASMSTSGTPTSRQTLLLIPPLIQKLSDPTYRPAALTALEKFDPSYLWHYIVPYLQQAVRRQRGGRFLKEFEDVVMNDSELPNNIASSPHSSPLLVGEVAAQIRAAMIDLDLSRSSSLSAAAATALQPFPNSIEKPSICALPVKSEPGTTIVAAGAKEGSPVTTNSAEIGNAVDDAFEAVAGAMRLLSAGIFPSNATIDLILSMLELLYEDEGQTVMAANGANGQDGALIESSDLTEKEYSTRYIPLVAACMQRHVLSADEVVNALVKLMAHSEYTADQSRRLDALVHAALRTAYETQHTYFILNETFMMRSHKEALKLRAEDIVVQSMSTAEKEDSNEQTTELVNSIAKEPNTNSAAVSTANDSISSRRRRPPPLQLSESLSEEEDGKDIQTDEHIAGIDRRSPASSALPAHPVCDIHRPLLLIYVEQTCQLRIKLAFKLLSTQFPKAFNVNLLLEALGNESPELQSSLQEVLETIIHKNHKKLLLPLLLEKNPQAIAAIAEKQYGLMSTPTVLSSLLKTWIYDSNDTFLRLLALDYAIKLQIPDILANLATDIQLFQTPAIQELFSLIPHIQENSVNDSITENAMSFKVESSLDDNQVASITGAKNLTSTMQGTESDRQLTICEVAHCIRSSLLFKSVQVQELVDQIAPRVSQKRIAANTCFLAEGNFASHMYVIALGRVRLHREGKSVGEAVSGDCVGDIALEQCSTQYGNYLVSATSITPCIILGITRSVLDELMKKSPAIGRGVLHTMANELQSTILRRLQRVEELQRVQPEKPTDFDRTKQQGPFQGTHMKMALDEGSDTSVVGPRLQGESELYHFSKTHLDPGLDAYHSQQISRILRRQSVSLSSRLSHQVRVANNVGKAAGVLLRVLGRPSVAFEGEGSGRGGRSRSPRGRRAMSVFSGTSRYSVNGGGRSKDAESNTNGQEGSTTRCLSINSKSPRSGGRRSSSPRGRGRNIASSQSHRRLHGSNSGDSTIIQPFRIRPALLTVPARLSITRLQAYQEKFAAFNDDESFDGIHSRKLDVHSSGAIAYDTSSPSLAPSQPSGLVAIGESKSQGKFSPPRGASRDPKNATGVEHIEGSNIVSDQAAMSTGDEQSHCLPPSYSALEKCLHLKGSRVFHSLSDLHVTMVAGVCDELQVENGESIYNEGEAAEYVFLVAEGTVEICLRRSIQSESTNAENSPSLHKTLSIAKRGDWFGEVSLGHQATYLTTAMAAGLTSLLRLRRDDLVELAEGHAPIMNALLKWLSFKITEQHVLSDGKSGTHATLSDHASSAYREYQSEGSIFRNVDDSSLSTMDPCTSEDIILGDPHTSEYLDDEFTHLIAEGEGLRRRPRRHSLL